MRFIAEKGRRFFQFRHVGDHQIQSRVIIQLDTQHTVLAQSHLRDTRIRHECQKIEKSVRFQPPKARPQGGDQHQNEQ